MLVSHAGGVLRRGAWVLLGVVLLCGVGCAGTYSGGVYQNSWKHVRYRMGTPNGWQPVATSDADIHLQNASYHFVSMISQSQCGESAASKTLPQLGASLFVDLHEVRDESEENLTLDQRPALHTFKTGALGGFPAYIGVITVVKDGCAYTFSLFQLLDVTKNPALAQEAYKQQPRLDFLQWVRGFSVVSEGAK